MKGEYSRLWKPVNHHLPGLQVRFRLSQAYASIIHRQPEPWWATEPLAQSAVLPGTPTHPPRRNQAGHHHLLVDVQSTAPLNDCVHRHCLRVYCRRLSGVPTSYRVCSACFPCREQQSVVPGGHPDQTCERARSTKRNRPLDTQSLSTRGSACRTHFHPSVAPRWGMITCE